MRLGILLMLCTASVSAQTKPPAKPVPRVSCALENHAVAIYDAQTKQSEDRDSWTATCSIVIEGKTMLTKPLALPMYTSLYEATTASGEFIKKEAPRLVKENKW